MIVVTEAREDKARQKTKRQKKGLDLGALVIRDCLGWNFHKAFPGSDLVSGKILQKWSKCEWNLCSPLVW